MALALVLRGQNATACDRIKSHIQQIEDMMDLNLNYIQLITLNHNSHGQKAVHPVSGSGDVLKAGGWVDAGDFWVLPQSITGEACSQACAILHNKLELLKVVPKYLLQLHGLLEKVEFGCWRLIGVSIMPDSQ